ncbi:ral guanine nucleotide dissociation stimulator-like [Mirounga angustirostris]|uniref:ral guanine nucleotide dissociation stimulator-like n=1 Tax=Mirounga angustirostris TaxID=9716 RepID=UPI00313D8CB7
MMMMMVVVVVVVMLVMVVVVVMLLQAMGTGIWDYSLLPSSRQETGQELDDEGLRAPSVKDRKVPRTGNRVQRWLRGKNGSATEKNETRELWTNQADLLEMPIPPGARLRRQRPQPHLHIPRHVHSFCHHPEVLDLFFTTYGGIPSTSDELGGGLEQRNMAISSILGTWLDQYRQDFFQPPDFPCLNVLLKYMGLHMPGSDLERRAQRLLSQLQSLEPPEPEAGGEEGRGCLARARGGDRAGHAEQASIECGWAGSSA